MPPPADSAQRHSSLPVVATPARSHLLCRRRGRCRHFSHRVRAHRWNTQPVAGPGGHPRDWEALWRKHTAPGRQSLRLGQTVHATCSRAEGRGDKALYIIQGTEEQQADKAGTAAGTSHGPSSLLCPANLCPLHCTKLRTVLLGKRTRPVQIASHFLSQFDLCFEVVGSHTLNFRSPLTRGADSARV